MYVYVCVWFLLSNQLISLIDSFPINSQDRSYHHVNVCPTDLYHCPQLCVNQGDDNNSRAVFPHSVPCVPDTLKITFSSRRACQVNSKTLNILSNQKPTRTLVWRDFEQSLRGGKGTWVKGRAPWP